VGLLTFHLLQPNGQYVMELGQPEVRGCVATVVDSENLSTIVTAAHCLAGDASFGGNHTDLEFAPAHTGPCWDAPTHPSGAHQLLVSQCGNNPFGVWYASPSDIQIWPGYHPDTSSNAEDYAFITMHPAPGRSLVQNAVGGFRLVWDTATSVTGDRLQSQPWVTVSYASDDPSFTTSYTFGPMQCSWSGDATSTHLGSSASRIGVQLANGGICDSFGPPKLGQFQLQGGLPFGASGSPFVNQSNTADGSLAVGAILSGGGAYTVNGVFVPTLQGTKFGANAQDTLNLAQTVQP
jgi:hypothetical protein